MDGEVSFRLGLDLFTPHRSTFQIFNQSEPELQVTLQGVLSRAEPRLRTTKKPAVVAAFGLSTATAADVVMIIVGYLRRAAEWSSVVSCGGGCRVYYLLLLLLLLLLRRAWLGRWRVRGEAAGEA